MQFADLTGFETVRDAALWQDRRGSRARVYNQAQGRLAAVCCCIRRKDVPAELNYSQNPREGDPVVVATGPYAIARTGRQRTRGSKPPTVGMHGFDPRKMPEMKASFFAAGPDIVVGKDRCAV
jgi:hypothetical protein